MRPKDIGTAGETAVVKYLVPNGWPSAERRSLNGSTDKGDVTGTPGIVWEVKSGKAAERASDNQVLAWLDETEVEREHANAAIGILVTKRPGVGAANVGRWWAIVTYQTLTVILGRGLHSPGQASRPLRMHLQDMVRLLRENGWGDQIDEQLDSAA
jgi:hypothetical protein